MTPTTRDDTPLWLFADQLGPAVYGGEHAHREVLLVEADLGAARSAATTGRSCTSCCPHCGTPTTTSATAPPSSRPTPTPTPSSSSAARSWSTSRRRIAAERFVHRLRKQGLVADVLPTPTFALPRKDFQEWAGDRTRFRMEDFYRDQRRRFDVLMDGSEPVGNRWNYDEDNREPPPKKQKTLGAAEALPTARGRHRRRRSAATSTRWTSTPSASTARACSPSPPPRPSARSTRFIEHRLPAVRPLRGRHHGRRLGDVALAAVGPAQPRRAASARRRRGRRAGLPRRRRPRWPPSRASSARSSAGASTCGICTGTSARSTPTTTHSARTSSCPTGGPTSTPTPSPPNACSTRSRASATAAGATTSSA